MAIRVAPGAQIRNALQADNWGTLGCIVQSSADQSIRYLLTAGHVVDRDGYAQQGEFIEMLGETGWQAIATLTRAVKLVDAPDKVQCCDAAIAQLLPGIVVDLAIPGIGLLQGVEAMPLPGMRLRFSGAGTNGTGVGHIESTGNSVPVYYDDNFTGQGYVLRLSQQILYGYQIGEVWHPSTRSRDSGAVLVSDSGHAVGLHIASTGTAYDVSASVCTPLQLVLDELAVALPSVHQPSSPDRDKLGMRSLQGQLGFSIRGMLEPHSSFGGASWRLGPAGLYVNGNLERTAGEPITVAKVWGDFEPHIVAAAKQHDVPVELIVATICTESHGKPRSFYTEPDWRSDATTPYEVSAGLMHTLIGVAQDILNNKSITREDLFDPRLSIDAGTACIASKRKITNYDPPLVACVYNHGSLKESSRNRWHTVQTTGHVDRFICWFNDFVAYLQKSGISIDAPNFSANLK